MRSNSASLGLYLFCEVEKADSMFGERGIVRWRKFGLCVVAWPDGSVTLEDESDLVTIPPWE